MIFTIDQINDIWQNKTAIVDKIYLCDDMFMYKGTYNKELTRILTGNLDGYKTELKRQQLALDQEEYQEEVTVESLSKSVAVLQSNINSKQTEVNFLEAMFLESIYVTVIDENAASNSIIQCSMSIESNRDADELEFTEFICTPCNIKPGVSYQVLVKDSNRQATGKYLLNTTRH